MDWRGRTREREVKSQFFGAARKTLTMDWRGRTRERQLKLHIFSNFSA